MRRLEHDWMHKELDTSYPIPFFDSVCIDSRFFLHFIDHGYYTFKDPCHPKMAIFYQKAL